MFRITLPFVSREAILRYDYGPKASTPRLVVSTPTVPRKLLIVRLSAVGDVVNVLPSLKTLRRNYPSTHIAWLVEDKAEGILRGHPDLDEVIVFPKKRWISGLKNPFTSLQTVAEVCSFVANLRRQGFEMALDFQGNLKSGIMTFLTGAPVRVGFARGHCKECNFLFTNRRIELPSDRLHRIEKNLFLLEGLGLRLIREGVTLPVSREDEKYIDSNLLTLSPPKTEATPKGGVYGPLVVIHSGTSDFGAYKRWPAICYAQLADRMVDEFKARILFTWG
ncbi:MAG: glycosyltransferase family 9 protein, partial [Candidatus Brocadiales bacterium]